MKSIYLLCLATSLALAGFTQTTEPQERLWLRGDTTMGGERAFRILVDAQGEIFQGINNYESYFFNPEILPLLAKYSAEGDQLWRRTVLDTPLYWEDLLMSPPDQAVVAYGTMAGGIDVVRKIDRQGQDAWTTFLPRSHKTYDMVIDAQGYLYLTGWNYQGRFPAMAVQKMSPQGEVLWNKTYSLPEDSPETDWEYGYNIAIGPTGDIYVSSWYSTIHVGMVRRLTSEGGIVWQTEIEQSGEEGPEQYPSDLLVNAAGEAYLSYRVDSGDYHLNNYMNQLNDGYLIKLGADGQEQWRQLLAPGQPHGRVQIQQLRAYDEDRVLVVANRPRREVSGLTGLLAMVDGEGNWQWEIELSGRGSGFANLGDVHLDESGFIYAGATSSCCDYPVDEWGTGIYHCCFDRDDMRSPIGPSSRFHWMVFKVNPSGQEVWRMNEAGQGDDFRDLFYDLALHPDGSVLATGSLMRRQRRPWGDTYWGVPSLGKYSNPAEAPRIPDELTWKVYPNPTRQGLHLELDLPEAWPLTIELYDLAGRTLAQRSFETSAGYSELTWHPALTPGLYLYRLTLGTHRKLGKLWWLE